MSARLQSAIATSETETPAGTGLGKQKDWITVYSVRDVCVRSVDETKDSLKFFSKAIIYSYSSLTELSFSTHQSEWLRNLFEWS